MLSLLKGTLLPDHDHPLVGAFCLPTPNSKRRLGKKRGKKGGSGMLSSILILPLGGLVWFEHDGGGTAPMASGAPFGGTSFLSRHHSRLLSFRAK